MKFVLSMLFGWLLVAMGQLRSDGRATVGGITWPAAQAIVFGDLYRVNGWNGIALNNVGASDTVRVGDMEIAPDRIWIVKLPAAVNPVKGDVLYWATADNSTFQRGDTNLAASGSSAPACKVLKSKDANGYAEVRVLNVGL